MKFISWNVNGLRACVQKGFLDFFNRSNADFFCLQETKLQEGQIELDLPGYHQYWCYAEKKGYSGTAIFTKYSPLSVQYGLGIPELDTEGRLITLEYPEFYLVTCYTPNAQRELARLSHRLRWEEAFRNYLQALDSQKPVILCGDLNVAHQEIDLKNPASNRGSAGFSDQERAAFSRLLESGFTDTFRYLNPTATGCYTWWSYLFNARKNNAGWRIDYFLVSDRIRQAVFAAPIHADVLGSDHCPVELQLDIPCNGSIWQSDSAGAANVIPKAAPTAKKALIAGTACLLFLLGFGAGMLTNGLLPDTGETAPPDISTPIIPGGPVFEPVYVPVSAVQARNMTTEELVIHISKCPILQTLASQYVIAGDGWFSIRTLDAALYQQYRAVYPALAELEAREDAYQVLRTQILLSSTYDAEYTVLLMLQSLDVFQSGNSAYVPISAIEAGQMSTAALIQHIAGIPDLQELSQSYVSVKYQDGGVFFIVTSKLTQKTFNTYKSLYPALAVLEGRQDAAAYIHSQINVDFSSPNQKAVLYMLQTLSVFAPSQKLITPDEAAEMDTLTLVMHVSRIPQLQTLAAEYISISGSTVHIREALRPETYTAYKALYPALAELEGREDGILTLDVWLWSGIRTPQTSQVCALLQTLDVFDPGYTHISAEAARSMTTTHLASYVSTLPYLQSFSQNYVGVYTGDPYAGQFDSYYIKNSLEPEAFESLAFCFPALQELAYRSDAPMVISDLMSKSGRLILPQLQVLAMLQTLDVFSGSGGIPVPHNTAAA